MTADLFHLGISNSGSVAQLNLDSLFVSEELLKEIVISLIIDTTKRVL